MIRYMLRKLASLDAQLMLRHKLLISFALIVLIPSICIGFFSHQKSSSIIQEQTSRAYLEALRQTTINISYRLTEVENISELIYNNEKLQKILRKAKEHELTMAEILDDYKNITEIIHNLEKSRNIFRIRLLVPYPVLYAADNQNIFNVTQDEFKEWNKDLVDQPGLMKWKYVANQSYLSIGVKPVVSLNRLILDFNNINTVLGTVAIDVDEAKFNDVLKNMNLTLPYQAMLFKNTEMITSYTHKPDQIKVNLQTIQETVKDKPTEAQNYKKIQLQGKDYLYLVQNVENVDWKLIVLIPALNITDQSQLLGVYIMILSVTLIAFAIGLSFLLSNRITRRLQILAEKMKGIEQGTLGEIVEIKGKDEISLLQRRFNKMSTQIKSLIDEVYTITINKQREEMKVLEGRINSHFLYNTLDTIKWMSIKSNAPEIATVVTNLSKFFRISLNRGQDTISVERELEHVKAYIDIQNIRFSGNIQYEVDIDASTLFPLEIIKLILQPIVENSIIHGINKSLKKQGTIIIRGRLRGERIAFYISDNGVGMNRETYESIVHSSSDGYGVKNVHQRIQLYYGSECGVKIRSRSGQGTVVRLLLKTTGPGSKSVRIDTKS
ncbi:sensor histidine kinase [Paenibacillus piri]|uniref:Sensor histidine kinase n=1 Tax=Paenibacillus piri TaxID=2547395 RepID=A0A4R5KV38_9BACL|nr:sensor histidine kinase [Paenibacillus piri]TDF98817.1 sensor histidine kinase [Paenibacillus piri]